MKKRSVKNMLHFFLQRKETMAVSVMSGSMSAIDAIISENFDILFELLKGRIGSGITIFSM